LAVVAIANGKAMGRQCDLPSLVQVNHSKLGLCDRFRWLGLGLWSNNFHN
jgi:hypothetical protein